MKIMCTFAQFSGSYIHYYIKRVINISGKILRIISYEKEFHHYGHGSNAACARH